MKLNKICRSLLLLTGSLLFINTTIMAVIANFNSGVIFSGILAIILILCGIYFNLFVKTKWRRWQRKGLDGGVHCAFRRRYKHN